MIYAKHKATQAEFVKAWWDEKDRKAWEKLKRDYPGIETVSFFNGMTYADKLRAIPNNALRRAGLKPRRRNGRRKAETVHLSLASMSHILTSTDKTMQRAIQIKLAQLTKQFADVGKMAVKAANAFDQFSDSHFQEDEQAGFRHWLETTQKQPYIGRVMIHKNEPFIIGCDLAQGESMTGRIKFSRADGMEVRDG